MERRRRTRRVRAPSPDVCTSSSTNEVDWTEAETTTASTSFATVVFVGAPCSTASTSLTARLMAVVPPETSTWQRGWPTRPKNSRIACYNRPLKRSSTYYWNSSVTTACAITAEYRTPLTDSFNRPSTSHFQQRANEERTVGGLRRQRYAADDQTTSVATAADSSSRCSPVTAAAALFVATMLLGVFIAPSLALPSRRSAYIVDIRQIGWPKAERTKDASERFTKLDCYTELDRSFVGGGDVYRLYSRKQLAGKSCLLRIPTRTRITFLEPTFRSAFSFARIIAGESQVSMPLATRKIYGESTGSDLGPWHVACSAAYLIFHSAAPTISARPIVQRRGRTQHHQHLHQHQHHQHHHQHHSHRNNDVNFYGDDTNVPPQNQETILVDEDVDEDGDLNLAADDDEAVESRADEPTDEDDDGEFVEFWLESETAADARDSARADCRAPGVNYAEIENL